MKVLIINSYAGSLVLGAKAAGCEIVGSYEDAAFGIEAQKLNFPELDYVDRLPWPERNLKGVTVIAHPPCAAFSVQNCSNYAIHGKREYMGTGTDAFACHAAVMDYSLGAGCDALAIESVPGVMKVANTYSEYAKKYGYSHYFLRLNSVGFGVPQWRPRVWIVFSKTRLLDIEYRPVYRPLKNFLLTEGTLVGYGNARRVVKKLKEAGVTDDTLREIFEGTHGLGSVLQIGKRVLGLDEFEVKEKWNLHGQFTSKMPRMINQEEWAPTILGDSTWFVNGRPLFMEEFCAIMGFPTDYQWPRSYEPRLYLSKGVCPPVATWILKQIEMNLAKNKPEFELGTSYRRCQPGELLDLCPKKQEVEDALAGRVPASPKQPKVRTPKAERKVKAAATRVRATASELSANFLKSLGE
jgi:site-specific DNA-cytosine methylase